MQSCGSNMSSVRLFLHREKWLPGFSVSLWGFQETSLLLVTAFSWENIWLLMLLWWMNSRVLALDMIIYQSYLILLKQHSLVFPEMSSHWKKSWEICQNQNKNLATNFTLTEVYNNKSGPPYFKRARIWLMHSTFLTRHAQNGCPLSLLIDVRDLRCISVLHHAPMMLVCICLPCKKHPASPTSCTIQPEHIDYTAHRGRIKLGGVFFLTDLLMDNMDHDG